MLQTVLRNTVIVAVLLVNNIKSEDPKFLFSPEELTWDKAEKVRGFNIFLVIF